MRPAVIVVFPTLDAAPEMTIRGTLRADFIRRSAEPYARPSARPEAVRSIVSIAANRTSSNREPARRGCGDARQFAAHRPPAPTETWPGSRAPAVQAAAAKLQVAPAIARVAADPGEAIHAPRVGRLLPGTPRHRAR